MAPKTPKPPKIKKVKPPKPPNVTTVKAKYGYSALAIICILAVTLGLGYGLFGWGGVVTPGEEVTTKTTANFTLTVIDGPTGAARNTTALTVYNTTAPGNWAAYTSTWTGVSQDELTTAVIAQIVERKGTANNFYLLATAANNVTSVHDWCPYASRWIELDVDGPNVLDFYATPTSTIGILFQQDGTAITLANFTADATYKVAPAGNYAYAVGNFSALIGINATDIGYCGYKGQFTPTLAVTGGDNGNTGIYLTFNFNSTAVVDEDLVIANVVGGTTNWTQVATLNSTCVAFYCPTLFDTSLVNFQWKPSVSDLLRVNNVELQYGTTVQVAAHTGTVLKVLI